MFRVPLCLTLCAVLLACPKPTKTSQDAAVAPAGQDAGVTLDAGSPPDASTVDAATADAANPPDASTPPDAAMAPDAATLEDAGARDASAAPDAATPDASRADAGPVAQHVWSNRYGDAVAAQEANAVAVDDSNNVIVAGDFKGAVNFGGGDLVSAGGQDIFVAKFDPQGGYLWAKRFGDALDYQTAHAVAVDGDGNVVVAGEFQGTVDFGGGPLVGAGGADVFVVKFDPNGGHLWSHRYGDVTDYQVARSVAVDSLGNVLLAGDMDGTLNFGGGPLLGAGTLDVFVAKLDPNGGHLWSKLFGDSSSQKAKGVAVDSANNVVVVGEFVATLDFGGGPMVSAGGADLFIGKLAQDGTFLWNKRAGDVSPRQFMNAVAVDANNNILVHGSAEGTVNFGGGDLTAVAALQNRDVYVAKLAPDGTHLWSKHFGDDSPQSAISLATDLWGNVILAGQFRSSIDFGGGPLTSSSYVMSLAKLDGQGNHVWSKQLGGVGDLFPSGLATDTLGNVVLAGRFWGPADFGGGNLPNAGAGDYDVFVAKLTP